jgi:branched-chain amino acid transport system ATP-binding protein
VSSLRLNGLSKRFGGLEAVANLSLTIEPGVVTGLIGPNGAGKSTIVNLITGVLMPTAGRILIGERSIDGLAPYEVARAGIARTFQNVRLLRETSVLDNIVIGFHRHERTSLWANLVGLPSVWRERRDFRERAAKLLERFGMTQYTETPAGALSYGHQRRVEVMRALASDPQFLLLDEPVAGMNDVEANELGAVVRELASAKIGILLIEHNMRFVMNLCDFIYVVDSGRLIASGPPIDIGSNPAVIEAYLGA